MLKGVLELYILNIYCLVITASSLQWQILTYNFLVSFSVNIVENYPIKKVVIILCFLQPN
jgi:hypothetical protein